MPTSVTPLPDLQETAIKALRTSLLLTENERTEHLRQAADSLVSAREHFFTKDGDPDWLGRTYAYRTWVREVYSLAGVPSADLATLQAAVRYHAGNIMRDRLSEDELTDLGLRSDSPRERSGQVRDRHSEILSIFGGGGQQIVESEQIRAALRMIEIALQRVPREAVAALAKEDRHEVAERVKTVQTLLKELSRDLSGSRVTNHD